MINKTAIFEYVKEEFGTEPEYLWAKFPDYAVLRHKHNLKWYAAIMTIPKQKIGLSEQGVIDILNIKCEPMLIDSLLKTKGYFPAYHMNKKHWISIALDGSVENKYIFHLLDSSFEITKSTKK